MSENEETKEIEKTNEKTNEKIDYEEAPELFCIFDQLDIGYAEDILQSNSIDFSFLETKSKKEKTFKNDVVKHFL
jgi:hypothetical protein